MKQFPPCKLGVNPLTHSSESRRARRVVDDQEETEKPTGDQTPDPDLGYKCSNQLWLQQRQQLQIST